MLPQKAVDLELSLEEPDNCVHFGQFFKCAQNAGVTRIRQNRRQDFRLSRDMANCPLVPLRKSLVQLPYTGP